MRSLATFAKQEILDKLDLLMEFYGKYYDKNYDVALKNSSHVCCCLEDDKIVGACRIVTDYCSHAFIVDLVVESEKRKQGIGREIMKNVISAVLELNTYFNSIETDPRNPWLKGFYESLGFESLENNFVLAYSKK
jgi:predicted GNAT family N-acyltransferase